MSTREVTAVIVHFHTPDLLERAVSSFRRYYPETPLLLVDNGSDERSTEVLYRLRSLHPATTELLTHARNLHHGPAMDDAVHRLTTPYVLFLDSDCTVVKGGCIERMLTHLKGGCYAAGTLVHMNRRGFDVEPGRGGVPYIRPVCMLIDRAKYLTLPPFERHGAPCLRNMTEAGRRGYRMADVPIEEYVDHQGRGTAGRFGYDLGWRGRVNHLLNRFGL
jgi:glycosyltransferase involved in cell wall biosynthesis